MIISRKLNMELIPSLCLRIIIVCKLKKLIFKINKINYFGASQLFCKNR